MYRSKLEVDKHVQNLTAKLSAKELNARAFSIARLYFDVGDYENCRRYVSQYLSSKDNCAQAHKLLGQTLQLLGQKEEALEQFKTSLNIDPSQNSLLLNICELFVDDEISGDLGRARYWCSRAEALFPRNPTIFRLREKLLEGSGSDEALEKLLLEELKARPRDASLHARLLQHYLKKERVDQAFAHALQVEFDSEHTFRDNFAWYETLSEVLVRSENGNANFDNQLIQLTALDRLCALSLTESNNGPWKSLVECESTIHHYDQALYSITKAGSTDSGKLHAALVQHHSAQLCLHAATYLLKRAKKDQLSWRLASRSSATLLLLALHLDPVDIGLTTKDRDQNILKRWDLESAYRRSQAGHTLYSSVKDKSQSFIDRVSQYCSGTHWRDKLYEKLFTNRDHIAKIKTSHLVTTKALAVPKLRIPRFTELQHYDLTAQKMYPNSLHHMAWMLIGYKNYAQFRCIFFDGLPNASCNIPNCGPETLSSLDVYAFLYCAALTAEQAHLDIQRAGYDCSEKPKILPASITDTLCTAQQMKWWDCAYKIQKKDFGSDLSDVRLTLSRGIEVVRCIDNHGLDPKLLYLLATIFNNRAKASDSADKIVFETRAMLYYIAATPLLERLKNNMTLRVPEKKLFNYTHKEISTKELINMLDESKLFVGIQYIKDDENEKAIEMLSNVKSPFASYHLAQLYMKMANQESNVDKTEMTSEIRSKHTILLTKAKQWVYVTLDHLKSAPSPSKHPLYAETNALIEKIESLMTRINPDMSFNNMYDAENKYSSDENASSICSEDNSHTHTQSINNSLFPNISSTPKHRSVIASSLYRNTVETNMYEENGSKNQVEKLEAKVKHLTKKDSAMHSFMEHTKEWIEENRNLVDEVREIKNNLADKIISGINLNIQDTIDQFKLLKVSVDQVKDKIGEYRDECQTDVGDLKREVAELKKEIAKLKSASSEQTIDENDLYNLDDEYQPSESSQHFNTAAAQLHFNPTQVLSGANFGQRVPPVSMAHSIYPLYGTNLYQQFYNQYSQLAQPNVAPSFDAMRSQVGFPGLPGAMPGVLPDQTALYGELPQLVNPGLAQNITAPIPVPPITIPPPSLPVARPAPIPSMDSRSLPVNVVITSSDPLPMRTTLPQPTLSVTIPPEHIKNSPHNYQIPLPQMKPIVSSTLFNVSESQTPRAVISWAPSPANKTPQPFETTPKPGFFDITKGIYETPKTGYFGSPNVNYTPDTSLNKSRTLSEKSNTSVEYDPCPDFKPIIPLPDEVEVNTGEENEQEVFSARAKLFRFTDKQWKERGLGNIKLLKHKETGKVRLLMRREQVHKICANHIITSNMDIQPMKNEEKAYFWAANDFAEETIVLEKFSIRFKTVDIARNFYDAFEKARKEANARENNIPVKDNIVEKPSKGFGDKFKQKPGSWSCNACYTMNNVDIEKCVACNTPKVIATATPTMTKPADIFNDTKQKQVFGGFSFHTPPILKEVTENKVEETIPETVKPSPFAAFSFKPQTSSPSLFSNVLSTPQTTTSSLFSTLSLTNMAKPLASSKSADISTKDNLNTPEEVEEFVPTADFKPVVPLPALVEVKTGEENETILFEHRAKLLRYDAKAKEWKERGLGIMKLLVNKDDDQKVRLLMRREQVLKVCCNHSVVKEMVFEKMLKNDKAITWVARDFSEENVTTETFCIRFKNADICDKFKTAIDKAQATLKTAVNNLNDNENKTNVNVEKKSTAGFGDMFKPKSGSWNCEQCYINNQASATKCLACEAPKDKPTTEKTAEVVVSATTAPVGNWGDKFKPKSGSWECKSCYITNNGANDYCVACDSPKDPSMPKKETTNSIFGNTGTTKFSFGIPATANTLPPTVAFSLPQTSSQAPPGGYTFGIKQESKELPKNIFSDSPSFGFKPATTESPKDMFGSSSPNNTGHPNFVSKSETKEPPKNIFGVETNTGVPNLGKTNESPFSFSFPKSDEPSDLSVSEGITSYTKKFEFVMKEKGKSPVKSPMKSDSDNEYAEEDDGAHIEFAPIIPLPDKVDLVTGEENEDILYSHRAKLFLFSNAEWKERGLGDIKVLKHKETGKLRVVMRREQVLKICLNHVLTPEIEYIPKDDKTWLFTANDYTDGEFQLHQFCLRFKTDAIATQFKGAIDKARGGEIKKLEESSETPKPRADSIEKVSQSMTLPFNIGDSKDFDFVLKSEQETHKKTIADHGSRFTPVVPLPEKVELVNGEEDEEVLYWQRAKLFLFATGKWRERGTGNVKILKHRDNGRIRVVMRRDQILKVCLNYVLTPDIEYMAKDVRSWLFTANDFVDGKPKLYCLRFKNLRTSSQFKKTIDKSQEKTVKGGGFGLCKDDEVICDGDQKVTSKDKESAKKLMLPENFFSYKYAKPCEGCRGCEDNNAYIEAEKLSQVAKAANNLLKKLGKGFSIQEIVSAPPVTPKKNLVTTEMENSIFTTPSNVSSSINTTLFGTPRDFSFALDGTSIADKLTANTTMVSGEFDDTQPDHETRKIARLQNLPLFLLALHRKDVFRDTKTEKKSDETVKLGPLDDLFSGLTVDKDMFKTTSSRKVSNDENTGTASRNLFGAGDSVKTSSDITPAKSNDAFSSIFGGTQITPVSGKNIFGTATSSPSVNMFGGADPSKNLFAAADSTSKNIFGGNSENKNLFGGTKSIFAPADSTPAGKTLFGTSDGAQSIFSGTPGKNIFGTADNASSTPKNIFGGTASITSANTNIFAKANSPQKPFTGSFGSSNTMNMFGGSNTSTNIFDKTPHTKEDVKEIEDQKQIERKVSFVLSPPKITSLGNDVKEDDNKTNGVTTASISGTASAVPSSLFEATSTGSTNVFGASTGSIFQASKPGSTPDVGFGTVKSGTKNIFGAPASLSKSVFGAGTGSAPAFGAGTGSTPAFGAGTGPTPAFVAGTGSTPTFKAGTRSTPAFRAGTATTSAFTVPTESAPAFEANPVFGASIEQNMGFGSKLPASSNLFQSKLTDKSNASSLFGTQAPAAFTSDGTSGNIFATALKEVDVKVAQTAANTSADFKWQGAGQPLFGAAASSKDKTKAKDCGKDKSKNGSDDETEERDEGEEYDPHYEPIVPLPDEIDVVTGEENEDKLFSNRAKVYRYYEDLKEWKERGVGNMKVLHDRQNNSYRLLLRRELIHKVALNQRITRDLVLKPMNKSDRAWTWAGCNYADDPNGANEMLAVRFSKVDVADQFKEVVERIVKDIQSSPVKAPSSAVELAELLGEDVEKEEVEGEIWNEDYYVEDEDEDYDYNYEGADDDYEENEE